MIDLTPTFELISLREKLSLIPEEGFAQKLGGLGGRLASTVADVINQDGTVDAENLIGALSLELLNVAALGWVQSCVFSVSDADTVAWGAGTFKTAAGTEYAIGGGNTGNMAAKTYVYFDTASPLNYQTTTALTDAVGAGKVLIAVCENSTNEATYFVLGGGGQNINASDIVANSIGVNQLATSLLYAGSIVIDTGGLIRSGQTDYDTGNGFWLGTVGGVAKFSVGLQNGAKITFNGTRFQVTSAFYEYIPYLIHPDDLVNTLTKWTEDGSVGSMAIEYNYESFYAGGAEMNGEIAWPVSPSEDIQLTTTRQVIAECRVKFQGAGTVGFAGAGFGFATALGATFRSSSSSNNDVAGFVISSGVLKARTGANTVYTDTTIASPPTLTNFNTYRIEYDLGNAAPQVRFYVNGTLKATHTTNLPSDATDMDFIYGSHKTSGTPIQIHTGLAPFLQVEK